MSCNMKDQWTVNVAYPGNLLQVKVQRGVAVHRQQLVIGCGITVLIQDL